MAFCPRWDEPLSTTQNTRSADAYGSWVMTCSTRRGERFDPGGGLAAAVDLGPVDVVGGQVGQRAAAVVVVADPHHPGLARGRVGWHRQRAWMEVFSSAEIT